MVRPRGVVLAVTVLVVLAGCGAPTSGPAGDTGPSLPPAAADAPPDPASDRIGWENGYWYNESLNLSGGDGYTRAELERILARTMARVEVIRDLEFVGNVSLEVISREEYRSRGVFSPEPDPWQDQVYEGLFLVGEDGDVADAFETVYGGSVAGYYSGGSIVLVTDDPSSVRVDTATLAHELVHALQDQHHGPARRSGESLDARTASRGLSEGEANYVMDRYTDRCGSEWSCLSRPGGGGGGREFNRGVFLTVFTPYSEGPSLVEALYRRGGWTRVTRAFSEPPRSTEQLIHPSTYPDEAPERVRVPDRSNRDWRRFGGRRQAETVGEAALYAMFWHNGVIPEEHLNASAVRYNYSYPSTAGWAGDRLVPYRDGGRFGYVFRTRWDTRGDAREFRSAYLDLLASEGAQRVRPNVYRIPDGPFADAFRVVRDGRTVTVVNGPTVRSLDGVHSPR